jgi:IS5 family transposase
VYQSGEGAGCPPVGLERILRIHFLQHWFNLAAPAAEEALMDSKSLAPGLRRAAIRISQV